MEITRTEECLHSDFKDGAVTFGVYLSPECDDDDELDVALAEWVGGGDVYLNFRFSIRGCVEDMIEFHKYRNEDGLVMEEKDKPMIEALRSELLEMVARLDEVRFAP